MINQPEIIRKKIILLTLILIYFLSPHLYSQNERLHFEKFDTKDGMSANSSLFILQDKKGFMWFGSQNGLNRYDGYNFKYYLNDPYDSASISDNYVFGLCEDELGGIWVSTSGQLNYYDPKTERFRRFPIDSSIIRETKINRITYVFPGKDSLLWFGTNAGTIFNLHQNFINDKNAHSIWLKALRKSHRVFKDLVMVIYEDRNGEMWIGGRGENIAKVNYNKDGKIKHGISDEYLKDQDSNLILKNTPKFIFESPSEPDVLLIGTYEGLYAFNVRTGKYSNWPESKRMHHEYRMANVSGMIEVKPGIFWIVYEYYGLLIYDKNNDAFNSFWHNPDDPGSLSTDKLFSIYRDLSENIWIGTLGELNKTRLNYSPFKKYIHHPDSIIGLSNSYVTSVCKDNDGTLWVGTRGGGLNKGILHPSNFMYEFSGYDQLNNVLDDNYIKAIRADKYGYLWIGIWSAAGGLYRLSPDRKQLDIFKNNPADTTSISSNAIRAIFEDSKGRLWIGTTAGGLSRVVNYSDPDGENIYFINYEPKDLANSLSQNDIFALGETNINNKSLLWIGTYTKGLNCFDPESGAFILFRNDPDDKNSICNDNIKTLFTDKKQNLWIGTANGLALLSSDKQDNFQFKKITKEDGLSDNGVQSVLEDDHGNLWISTANGITKYNPENKSFIQFNEGDNFPGNEFVLNAGFRSSSGEMFFGGLKGLVQFHPDSVHFNDYIPPVVITSFKVFEQELRLDTSITEIKEIILDYNQNFFSMEFAALDFREPLRNKFAYKLEGIHNDWVYSDSRRYVNFSHLAPGEYIFRVKGSNNDGIWNEEGASLAINILPPYWMTTWFRISVGLILLTFGIWVIRYLSTRTLKKKIRELEIQQKIQSERERISDDLHDHIGSHLSNIVTGLEISGNLIPQKEKTKLREHIINLETYTRATIGELRRTIGSLNQKESSISSLVEQINKSVEERIKLNDKPVITFNYNTGSNIPVSSLLLLNIFRVFQEALNNAIKYSKADLVNICLEVKDKRYLIFKVTDNGIGFDCLEEQVWKSIPRLVGAGSLGKEKGHGLASMKRRAERMGGTLSINSKPGEGTAIELAVEVRPE